MCTVSYIPLPGGYVLTTNRDEDPERETGAPKKTTLANGRVITAPRDMEKGGTWIAIDDSGRASCLLNGAFTRHQRQPPYRKSRGLLVTEAFEAPDFVSFARDVSLDGIEPFTQIFTGNQQLLKMVWDGTRKYFWELPVDSVHLWSSPTLYSPAQHSAKEIYFKESLTGGWPKPGAILQIHGNEGITPFILERPGVRTVSITQVCQQETSITMEYYPKKALYEKAASTAHPA